MKSSNTSIKAEQTDDVRYKTISYFELICFCCERLFVFAVSEFSFDVPLSGVLLPSVSAVERFAFAVSELLCRESCRPPQYSMCRVNLLASVSFSIGLQLKVLVFLQFYGHTDERKDVWRVCLACFPPKSMASLCQELHSQYLKVKKKRKIFNY